MQKNLYHVRSIRNNNVVAEEKKGYAGEILPQYNNELSPDLTERIRKMSAVEVIS